MGRYKCIEQNYWGPTKNTRKLYFAGDIYNGELPVHSDGIVNKHFEDMNPVVEPVKKLEVKKEVAEVSINDMTKRQICTKYGIELSAKEFATTKKADLIAMALGE